MKTSQQDRFANIFVQGVAGIYTKLKVKYPVTPQEVIALVLDCTEANNGDVTYDKIEKYYLERSKR